MKIKKRIIALLCAVMTLSAPMSSMAKSSGYGPGSGSWIWEDVGWWFQNGDGSYPQNEWKQIGSTWYYFDQEGYMKTGLLEDDGKVYYLNEDGAMVKETAIEINGVQYEFGADGAAAISFPYKSPTVVLPDDQKTDIMRANDAIADGILGRIINAGMSESQKATAIYNWIRSNMRYAVTRSSRDWHQEAYNGFQRRRGDCYVYYSVANQLLTRAGISTIEVIRSSDNEHYWNLVYVDGNWRHFDTTPRIEGGVFCLLTDAQITAYSNAHGWSHYFDPSLYPPAQ